MDDFWRGVGERLEQGNPVAVLVVAHHRGSTPGKAGFKMAIHTDGTQQGTIGGGIMEGRLSAKAMAGLAQAPLPKPELITQVHHNRAPEADQSGMICAGTQKLILLYLSPEIKNRKMVDHLMKRTLGHLTISPQGMAFDQGPTDSEKTGLTEQEGAWRYLEETGSRHTAYIIGGGHVGLATCRALAPLDFRIVVMDHRAEVETMARNTFAHQKIIADYNRVGGHIEPGAQSYVVIVTSAFDSDATALAQVIHKDLGYLGLMGSAAKIKKIFQVLTHTHGVNPGQLEKVHAPIGLPIKARTPAEIGISIAAQMIQIRGQKQA